MNEIRVEYFFDFENFPIVAGQNAVTGYDSHFVCNTMDKGGYRVPPESKLLVNNIEVAGHNKMLEIKMIVDGHEHTYPPSSVESGRQIDFEVSMFRSHDDVIHQTPVTITLTGELVRKTTKELIKDAMNKMDRLSHDACHLSETITKIKEELSSYQGEP